MEERGPGPWTPRGVVGACLEEAVEAEMASGPSFPSSGEVWLGLRVRAAGQECRGLEVIWPAPQDCFQRCGPHLGTLRI